MISRENYTTLQQYAKYLKTKGICSRATLEIYQAYNTILLEWAGDKPLKNAPSFEISLPKYLSEKKNANDEPYSSSYIKSVCSYTRRFYYWARDNCNGYKNITAEWIDSIIPTRSIDEVKEIVYYTLDEAKRICSLEPQNMREKRAIAAIAFLLLSGMRIAAFFTLPIKNVKFAGNIIRVRQSPKDGVCTKNNKPASTSTFSCPPLMKIVQEWDDLVRLKCPENSSWYARLDQNGNFDPREIIPMTVENADDLKAKARNPYKNFCHDLRALCKRAGVEYKSPHKARYGHIHLLMSKAKTAEERKAISMNVMHGSTAITDEVYMRMSSEQVGGIISGFNFDEPENIHSEPVQSGNPLLNAFAEMDSETLIKMSQILASAAASHSKTE